LDILDRLSKNTQISNFSEAELLYADGQTTGQKDKHDKANSPSSQFCECD